MDEGHYNSVIDLVPSLPLPQPPLGGSPPGGSPPTGLALSFTAPPPRQSLMHPSTSVARRDGQQNVITIEPMTEELSRFLDDVLSDSSDSECEIVTAPPSPKKCLQKEGTCCMNCSENERSRNAHLTQVKKRLRGKESQVRQVRSRLSLMEHRAKEAENKLATLRSETTMRADRIYETSCRVCYINEIQVTYLPCLHQLVCISCFAKMEKVCPIDRKPVLCIGPVYRS